MLIDTHCHLDSSMDLERIVKEAKENNVKYLILGGTSLKDNAENICLTKKFSNVFTAVGYHPDSASSFVFDDINILEKQINNNDKVIAIGEIGLDYHYGKENKEKQILLFEEQLKLAEKLHKPVVIHSRDATLDTINILKKYKVKGVIHCFSGSLEIANEYIKMEFLLGIGGVVTFKNSNLGEVLKNISLDNIALETDSPYLSPIRGETNYPANILIIAKYLSELYGVSMEEIENITTFNVKKVFNLKI